jgi:predicted amidohydrolase YtcJ
MEHLGLMTEEQIKRASQMQLGLSFFVNHLYFYGTSFSNFILGPERTKRWAPCSLGTKYGLRWTLHQDHPTHPGPPLPFVSMQTAVTRTERFQPDTVYGPEYCVSIHEALKGKIS